MEGPVASAVSDRQTEQSPQPDYGRFAKAWAEVPNPVTENVPDVATGDGVSAFERVGPERDLMASTSAPIDGRARACWRLGGRSVHLHVVWAVVVAVAMLVCAGVTTASARAASWPFISARIVAHFSYSSGQTPEDLAIEPDGAADISLSIASQVARVSLDGRVQIVAELPQTGNCPVFNLPITTGIVRLADGSLDVVVCDGDADTGVWRVRAGHAPVQITHLPANSVPNDMAFDPRTGNLYIADSLLGVVWRVPSEGGPASVWASGPALQPISFAGANGAYVLGDSVYVSNSDQGTIVRIPIRADGTSGAIETVATGLAGVDNFTVLPGGIILTPLEDASQVVLVEPDGARVVLLTAADGLSNPVDVKLGLGGLYVADAAYLTQNDPNLLVARLDPGPWAGSTP
jgi:hypothetical protein